MLISIITINFNDLEGLKNTMTSVLDQTYNNIEYIIIDGGSTDGSKEFIKTHQESLAYWVSEPDKGIYNAMNKGIAKAKGAYVLFLNSGDSFYIAGALAVFAPNLVSEKDIYYGNIEVVAAEKRIQTYPSTVSFDYFVKKTLPHPAALIKRKCLTMLPFDESLKIVSDWKFFVQGICEYGFTYEHIDDVITSFAMDGISSTNPTLVKEERTKVLETDFPLLLEKYRQTRKLKRASQNAKKNSKFEQLIKRLYRKLVK